MHAARQPSVHATQETLPFMGSQRPNLARFAEHLAAEYAGPRGADRLAAELARTSKQAIAGSGLPEPLHSGVQEGTRTYLAPALLGFADAWAKAAGQPLTEQPREVVERVPPTSVSARSAATQRESRASSKGIGPIREQIRAEVERWDHAKTPHTNADFEQHSHALLNLGARQRTLLDEATHEAYGESAGRWTEYAGLEGEEAKSTFLEVRPGQTITSSEEDFVARQFNHLLALRAEDPARFDAVVQKMTVDPTEFFAVLMHHNRAAGAGNGDLARVLEPTRSLLPGKHEQRILTGFTRLFAAMKYDPRQAEHLSPKRADDPHLPVIQLLEQRATCDFTPAHTLATLVWEDRVLDLHRRREQLPEA